MATPLGRSVLMNDWRSFHHDTIMKVLYGVARSPFNPQHRFIALDALPQVTGLDQLDVDELVAALEVEGLAEVDKNVLGKVKAVRISAAGVQWVSHLLLRLDPSGSLL